MMSPALAAGFGASGFGASGFFGSAFFSSGFFSAGFGGSAPSGSVTASGYQTARALHETYRARTARLEFERLSGMLVPADDVRSQAFTAARRVRDSILALPDRLAPVLAAITDPAEIHRALAAELRQALEELSNATRA